VIDPTGGPGAAGQRDPSVVYDGGVVRPILTTTGSFGFVTNGTTVIPAAAGLKNKLLGFNIFIIAWTSEGSISIKDGAGGTNIFTVARVPTPGVGNRYWFEMGGQMIGAGSINTLVELNYNATATIGFTFIYYQAP
jgi:hypothetical protein